jgi:hypothetical protein
MIAEMNYNIYQVIPPCSKESVLPCCFRSLKDRYGSEKVKSNILIYWV